MPSDQELLEAWRRGDQNSGSELFRRYFRTVRLYFANKVAEAPEVEELVQATFVACVESRDRFEGRAEFKHYLFGIARNLLYKRWRSLARAHSETIENLSLADLGASPSSVFARGQDEQRLLLALRHIPLKHQETIELYYWQEMTGTELALALGLSEDGARARLRRAKELLKRELNRRERFADIAESTDEDLESWARRVRAIADA